MAGAHDFRELRLLAALRSGLVSLPPSLAVDARRLAGAHGTSAAARDALRRWRPAVEDVALTAAQRRAAAVVVRTCEGLLAEH